MQVYKSTRVQSLVPRSKRGHLKLIPAETKRKERNMKLPWDSTATSPVRMFSLLSIHSVQGAACVFLSFSQQAIKSTHKLWSYVQCTKWKHNWEVIYVPTCIGNDVLTAVVMKSSIFWYIKLWSPLKVNWLRRNYAPEVRILYVSICQQFNHDLSFAQSHISDF
jgi:hypothetical protein